jgi:hypothetical protein
LLPKKLGAVAGIRARNTALAQLLEAARGEQMVSAAGVAILDESSMVSLRARRRAADAQAGAERGRPCELPHAERTSTLESPSNAARSRRRP